MSTPTIPGNIPYRAVTVERTAGKPAKYAVCVLLHQEGSVTTDVVDYFPTKKMAENVRDWLQHAYSMGADDERTIVEQEIVYLRRR